jgi:hypothetical protein
MSQVSRTAVAGLRSVRPGVSVVVQGRAGKDGSVVASSITATAAGGQGATQGAQGGGSVDSLFGP